MEVKVQAIHFDISDKLEGFIHKKTDRLYRRFDNISEIEVRLNVVKPETAMNKEAGIKILVPNTPELFASKTADTFEEAIDLAIEALERQLEKNKERK